MVDTNVGVGCHVRSPGHPDPDLGGQGWMFCLTGHGTSTCQGMAEVGCSWTSNGTCFWGRVKLACWVQDRASCQSPRNFVWGVGGRHLSSAYLVGVCVGKWWCDPIKDIGQNNEHGNGQWWEWLESQRNLGKWQNMKSDYLQKETPNSLQKFIIEEQRDLLSPEITSCISV